MGYGNLNITLWLCDLYKDHDTHNWGEYIVGVLKTFYFNYLLGSKNCIVCYLTF